jgi:spore germination cell wall hydrolase CwlJ-like protein
MKKGLAALAACGLLVVTAQAQRGGDGGGSAPSASRQAADWGEWTRPLAPVSNRPEARTAAPASAATGEPEAEVDVVDAHWMALTMWGEARGQGEEGMRAVGHVIRNRREAKKYGDYVTDTVSQAFQFSAWNKGDPNRAAMLAIEDLPKDGEGYRQWLEAKRLAAEIMSGRSADPTGGALFYHTTAVQPKWSEGLTSATQIGDHLFFLAAR